MQTFLLIIMNELNTGTMVKQQLQILQVNYIINLLQLTIKFYNLI